jgi:hypothetical protein
MEDFPNATLPSMMPDREATKGKNPGGADVTSRRTKMNVDIGMVDHHAGIDPSRPDGTDHRARPTSGNAVTDTAHIIDPDQETRLTRGRKTPLLLQMKIPTH